MKKNKNKEIPLEMIINSLQTMKDFARGISRCTEELEKLYGYLLDHLVETGRATEVSGKMTKNKTQALVLCPPTGSPDEA